MIVLIDSNIVLDQILKNENFYEDAESIIALSEVGVIQGYVSVSAVTDIYYIARKYETCFILWPCAILSGAKNNRAALDNACLHASIETSTRNKLQAHLCRTAAWRQPYQNRVMALKLIRVLLSCVRVARVDERILRKAVDLGWSDFEDSVQYSAGESVGAEYIVTRDAKGFLQGDIETVDPKKFLAMIQEN